MQKLGEVELLVNAAGTNAPRRSLEVLSSADYHMMIDTNLNGGTNLQALLGTPGDIPVPADYDGALAQGVIDAALTSAKERRWMDVTNIQKQLA